MEHTYLFKEGMWMVRGTYFDVHNNKIPVEGKTTVTHPAGAWIKEGYMKLLDGSGHEIKNRYEITPFKGDYTNWKSSNPVLGTLHGKYMVVGDTILSTFTSENGEYHGIESNVKVSDNIYKCRGFTFGSSNKLSSWATELVYAGKVNS